MYFLLEMLVNDLDKDILCENLGLDKGIVDHFGGQESHNFKVFLELFRKC